jgi:hypothetical protein
LTPSSRSEVELVQPIGVDAPEVTARFRDPAGNVIGFFEEPGRAASAEERHG